MNFPVFFLPLISGITPWWQEELLGLTSVPLNFLSFVLWANIWFILENAHAHLRRMCILVLLDGMCCIYINKVYVVSLVYWWRLCLFFSLDDLSIADLSTLIILYCIVFYFFLQVCYYLLYSHMGFYVGYLNIYKGFLLIADVYLWCLSPLCPIESYLSFCLNSS